MPAMNVVLRGTASFSADAFASSGIVGVHHGHQAEIGIDGATTTGTATSAMSDRLFLPPGGRFAVMTGYGHYHDTCEKLGGEWKLKTTRITRLRVEAE